MVLRKQHPELKFWKVLKITIILSKVRKVQKYPLGRTCGSINGWITLVNRQGKKGFLNYIKSSCFIFEKLSFLFPENLQFSRYLDMVEYRD